MDLLRFSRELAAHYDCLFYPTEIRGEIKELEENKQNQNRYLGHLCDFARSLLNKHEFYLQLGGVREFLVDRQERIIQVPVENLKYLMSRSTLLKGKIGFCYIDQQDSSRLIVIFQMLKPYLSEQACITVHHINQFKTRKICVNWLKKGEDFSLLFFLPTPAPGFPTWNDGLLLMGYSNLNCN